MGGLVVEWKWVGGDVVVEYEPIRWRTAVANGGVEVPLDLVT